MATTNPTWAAHALDGLRDAGFRSGDARRTIVEYLDAQDCCLSAQELHARLRALLRRLPEVLPPTLNVADLTVDTRSQTVRRSDRTIPVTMKEYALLEYLARNAGRVVGRAELCEHVWDENHDPFSNALEVYINRLRRKVDDGSPTPLIHTHRGAGYRLGTNT